MQLERKLWVDESEWLVPFVAKRYRPTCRPHNLARRFRCHQNLGGVDIPLDVLLGVDKESGLGMQPPFYRKIHKLERGERYVFIIMGQLIRQREGNPIAYGAESCHLHTIP